MQNIDLWSTTHVSVELSLVGARFGFGTSSVSVGEDSGETELCLTFSGEIPQGENATVIVETIQGSAIGRSLPKMISIPNSLA